MQELVIDAEPEPFRINTGATAVLVVDMQNDFGSKDGMLDRAGIPIGDIQRAIGPTSAALAAARRAGIKVVYLKMGYRSDLSDLGGPDSPNRLSHERFGVGKAITRADGGSYHILVRDEWGTDIVDELKPDPGEVVVYKTRFSGFYQTDLDDILRAAGVKSLIVTGCTTSICVESTLRDAFFRDYRCLLIQDCTAEPIGSDLTRSNHEATILLARTVFGAVSTSERFVAALDTVAPVY
jgi:nicotinamidase-related amidase